jgi:hypothetical protein
MVNLEGKNLVTNTDIGGEGLKMCERANNWLSELHRLKLVVLFLASTLMPGGCAKSVELDAGFSPASVEIKRASHDLIGNYGLLLIDQEKGVSDKIKLFGIDKISDDYTKTRDELQRVKKMYGDMIRHQEELLKDGAFMVNNKLITEVREELEGGLISLKKDFRDAAEVVFNFDKMHLNLLSSMESSLLVEIERCDLAIKNIIKFREKMQDLKYRFSEEENQKMDLLLVGYDELKGKISETIGRVSALMKQIMNTTDR